MSQQLEDKYRKLVEQVENLKIESSIFRELFEKSPTPMWEEDFTEVFRYIQALKDSGITDLKDLFNQHPNELDHFISLIKIVNVNKATVVLHKAKSKKYFLNNYSKLFSDYSIEAFKEEFIRLANGETSIKLETLATCFDKSKKNLELYLEVTRRIENGKVKYYALVSTIDITHRIKNQRYILENERSIRAIFNSCQDIIMLIDIDGVILDVNEHFAKIANSPREDLIGLSIFNFMDTNLMSKSIERLSKVQKTNVPYHAIDKYRDKVWESYLYPILDQDETVNRFALFSKEITEKYHYEQGLKEINKHLQQLNSLTSSKKVASKEEIVDLIFESLSHNISGIKMKLRSVINTNTDPSTVEKSIIDSLDILEDSSNILKGIVDKTESNKNE